MIDKEMLAGLFRLVARQHFKASALLASLALQISEDDEMLKVAQKSNPKGYPPLLFMAAVHAQVLADPDCELARFFPTTSGQQVPCEDPYPAFKAHVLEHRESIETLIHDARVNKTVPQRSACLRAMLVDQAKRKSWRRVHLIDMGCGAGLNLLMDQWRISYGRAGAVGPEDASVRMEIELRGAAPPMDDMPEVLSRTGIDLDRFDLTDPADERWLLGFILPDQPEMMELSRNAFACLRQSPPRLIQGDLVKELPKVLAELPGDDPVVVMHSMVFLRMSARHKTEINRTLLRAAESRPLVRIGMEAFQEEAKLMVAEPGREAPSIVGSADRNAAWMNWCGDAL